MAKHRRPLVGFTSIKLYVLSLHESGKDVNCSRFRNIFILNFWREFRILKLLSCWIPKCLQSHHFLADGLYRILSSYWLAHLYLMNKSAEVCTILMWISGCWNSSNILLRSHTPQNNYWLSRIFGDWFGGKDCDLCQYNLIAGEVGGIFVWSGSELCTLFKYLSSN